MDDGLRVMDAPHPGAPDDAASAASEPDPAPARRPRRWLRRLGIGFVVVVALVPVGLQVQAARVRDQVNRAETTQRIAELDEESAQIRLDSVDARVRVAEDDEAEAQARLDGSRKAMTDKGFEESALPSIQVEKATEVKDLRAQVKAVAAAIAEQNRLQPAAAACVFDRLRDLAAPHSGATAACKTVARRPGAG